MMFSDFTSLSQIQEQFKLGVQSTEMLFVDIADLPLPQHYAVTLDDNVRVAIAINNEKARSEFIIAPLLMEAWRMERKTVSLFSGIELKVASDQGLCGRCNFIFSASPERMFLQTPILTIVEAKNDNVQSGFAQCIAEMYAAMKFNEQQGRTTEYIFGCTTTGTEWRFMKLSQVLCLLT